MVAICTIELFLPAAGSLKDKRHIVQSIIDRLRGRMHAAAAETGAQDVWQRATITVAVVNSNRAMLERQVDMVRRLVEDNPEAAMVHFATDYV